MHNVSFHLASGDRTACLVAGCDTHRYVHENELVPQIHAPPPPPSLNTYDTCNGLPLYVLQILLPDKSAMGSGTGKKAVSGRKESPPTPASEMSLKAQPSYHSQTPLHPKPFHPHHG